MFPNIKIVSQAVQADMLSVETQAYLDFAGQDSYSILFFLTRSGLNNNAPTYIEQLVQLQR